MLPSDLKNSFIIKNFILFFNQLIIEKKQAAEPPSTSFQEETEQKSLYAFVGGISRDLALFLESQEFGVAHEGGEFLSAYYHEALYIMVALADEIFLNFKWVGQNIWDMYLIEQRIFKTQIAGEKFFENLDYYLLTRDPLKVDLGALYYFALALGFQGKYRGMNDNGMLQSYMHQLFLYVMRKEPDFQKSTYLLFPEAYEYTQTQGEIVQLSNPRAWYGAFLGLIFGMGLVGSGLWYWETWDLNRLTVQILDHD